MQQAAVPACHAALGQDMLEEPAEQLHGVEIGRAWACTAALTGGEGDGATRARDDAAGGDGDLEARGGEVCDGRVAVGGGLAVNVPVGVPDRWIDRLSQSSVVHIFFAENAVHA
jgi:hypothetical protein